MTHHTPVLVANHISRRFHEIVHGFHHQFPDDPQRLVMPLAVSIGLASLVGGWFDNWSTYHRLPQAIADMAKAGDVVLCMGAGSIGAVPAKILQLLQKTEHNIEERRGQ